jgi:hypothetical protein
VNQSRTMLDLLATICSPQTLKQTKAQWTRKNYGNRILCAFFDCYGFATRQGDKIA